MQRIKSHGIYGEPWKNVNRWRPMFDLRSAKVSRSTQ